ncbi:hypothetical protein ABFA07_021664 [Porites harrisoni]
MAGRSNREPSHEEVVHLSTNSLYGPEIRMTFNPSRGQFRVNNGSIVSINTVTTIKVHADGQTFTITRDQNGPSAQEEKFAQRVSAMQ